MKITRAQLLFMLLPLLGGLAGCAGNVSLPAAARAGDTIALGAGWKNKFQRESLTVTITGSDYQVVTYSPGDPAVRAVINLYPDPLSYMVVGTRVGLGGYDYRYGDSYGSMVSAGHTLNDPDWWQTSIYLDLPSNLPQGTAQVEFQSPNGGTYGPIPVEIIPGAGSPNTFSAQGLGDLQPIQMQSMERAPMATVRFSGGSELPASIQVDLTHAPDSSVGGTGKTFVVNPRGEMKNLTWTDNGTNLRVLLLGSGDGTSKDPELTTYMWKYFKFYVTGGVTGVTVQNVKAYDINGNLMAGVTATATAQ